MAQTRALHRHHLTGELAGRFGVVVVENLNVSGMAHRKRHLGRYLADASLAQIRHQLTYKTAEHSDRLVAVDRWFPPSKTCSSCGPVRAKLELWERT